MRNKFFIFAGLAFAALFASTDAYSEEGCEVVPTMTPGSLDFMGTVYMADVNQDSEGSYLQKTLLGANTYLLPRYWFQPTEWDSILTQMGLQGAVTGNAFVFHAAVYTTKSVDDSVVTVSDIAAVGFYGRKNGVIEHRLWVKNPSGVFVEDMDIRVTLGGTIASTDYTVVNHYVHTSFPAYSTVYRLWHADGAVPMDVLDGDIDHNVYNAALLRNPGAFLGGYGAGGIAASWWDCIPETETPAGPDHPGIGLMCNFGIINDCETIIDRICNVSIAGTMVCTANDADFCPIDGKMVVSNTISESDIQRETVLYPFRTMLLGATSECTHGLNPSELVGAYYVSGSFVDKVAGNGWLGLSGKNAFLAAQSSAAAFVNGAGTSIPVTQTTIDDLNPIISELEGISIILPAEFNTRLAELKSELVWAKDQDKATLCTHYTGNSTCN